MKIPHKHLSACEKFITDGEWTGKFAASGHPVITLDGELRNPLEVLHQIDANGLIPENNNWADMNPANWVEPPGEDHESME